MIPMIMFAAGVGTVYTYLDRQDRNVIESEISKQQKQLDYLRESEREFRKPYVGYLHSSYLIEKEIKKIESPPNQTSWLLTFWPFSQPVEESSYKPNHSICQELKRELETASRNIRYRDDISSYYAWELREKDKQAITDINRLMHRLKCDS